jgi:MATE family multidrug resistance protein
VGWFAHLGARAGDTILAANAILLNFQTFLSFGLDGFAQAAETLVGEAAGERNRAHFKKALNITFLWSTVGALLLAVLYGVAGGPIVDLLTDHPDVREAAHRYLPWVALTPVASLGGFLLDGVFIGATRTGALMKAMLFSMTFFLLTSWILTSWLGNHGLWLSFILFLLVRGATLAVQLPSLSVHIGQARNA